jgi:Protein of unknown function (DUF3096)
MTQVNIVLLQPWIALIFGILILIVPQVLNYLVAAGSAEPDFPDRLPEALPFTRSLPLQVLS